MKQIERKQIQSGLDSIATIETELLTLVRALETLGRKSSLYLEVDRAGYLALRTLERIGPVPTNTLAHSLHLDASTVTRQVTALAVNGFVERRPNPHDGRSSHIAITEPGMRAMRDVEKNRSGVLQELFDDWEDRKLQTLGQALSMLNSSMFGLLSERHLETDSNRES